MMEISVLKNKVIIPTLDELGLLSQSAINLLLGTCAVESNLGRFDRQVGGGPALGIFQVEPPTNKLVLDWLLRNKPDLFEIVIDIRGKTHVTGGIVTPDINKAALQYNDHYSCAIARCLYLSIPSPLPASDDVLGMAHYWKNHYNSPQGKGTVEDFVEKYKRLVEPFL